MTALRERTSSPFLSRTFLQLSGISVVSGVSMAFALPFGSLFLTSEIKVTPFQLGFFLIVSPVAQVVASTIMGRLSDGRVQRRYLLAAGGAAGAIGYGLFAVLRDYWFLLGTSVVFIAITGALLPQLFAYGRQVSQGPSMVVSVLRTLLSVAWVAGPPVAALLVAKTGWIGLFASTAVLQLGVAVLALTLPVPPARAEEEKAEEAAGSAGGTMVVVSAAFLFLQGAVGLAVSGLPLFITTELHGTAGDAGIAMGLCAALEIPMMLWFGSLANRMSQHRLVLIGATIALGYHGLMVFTDSIWQVMAAQLLHATVISLIMGVGITYFQSLDPGRPGHATTMFSNTQIVGGMVAGALLGVSQQLGFRWVYGFSLAMSVAGLALLLVAGSLDRRSGDLRLAARA
ncbi:SET family sugar efflux transporter-like MFS transporter [Lentzea flaviverrucosa]|uniref:MFS transporter, SET family, sugar efflux transporter n=1 Tax=Lentzea flaviverrucosa TaxID=200379 RepID=A0A1H9JSF0_9PSEU|nr:SET family sugar efflux transporter-like MFS transporter [Lentzea flaviverrucosa]SEQ89515.1 MFS transporter, SET family, sugar efflux transporter [Lentzea flaviverrucosa]